jgi:hypothetical protein
MSGCSGLARVDVADNDAKGEKSAPTEEEKAVERMKGNIHVYVSLFFTHGCIREMDVFM